MLRAAPLDCSTVQRCHHGAEEQAQRAEEQDNTKRRRRHDRDAGHGLALQDDSGRRHLRCRARDGAGRSTGGSAGPLILALHAPARRPTRTRWSGGASRRRARRRSRSSGLAFSKETSWIIDLIIVGVAGGAALTYSCFTGDLLQATRLASSARVILLLTLFPSGPWPCYATSRRSSILRSPAMAVAVSALVIVSRSLDGSYGRAGAFAGWLRSSENALDQVSTNNCPWALAVLFNMLSTAFMCHTNAVRAYDELGPATTHDESRRCRRPSLAGLLYGVVMLAGYVTFGGACEGLVLANYDADPSRPLSPDLRRRFLYYRRTLALHGFRRHVLAARCEDA